VWEEGGVGGSGGECLGLEFPCALRFPESQVEGKVGVKVRLSRGKSRSSHTGFGRRTDTHKYTS
jgi:hypothetical protein